MSLVEEAGGVLERVFRFSRRLALGFLPQSANLSHWSQNSKISHEGPPHIHMRDPNLQVRREGAMSILLDTLPFSHPPYLL